MADKGRKPKTKASGPVTTDPRFAAIHTDPRFARPKRKDVKVPLDSRFKAAFKDKEFIDQPSVDRYGRKLDKDEGKRLVKRFYRMEDEAVEKSSSDSEEEEEEPEVDFARGIGIASSSEDESDEEVDEGITDSVLIEEDIPKGHATHRLAAVNLDWDNIHALDILAVMQSFIPTTSDETIKSVKVYPSDFGKERLHREAIKGPAVFDKPTNSAEDSDEVNSTALRNYQLERLRYYYAIIECSSISIANVLYKALDGAELGSTANIFDVRFVPDDVTFEDTPKEVAMDVPDGHQPPEFVTDALQHSKPKLTWEGEDPERKRIVLEAFKGDAESGQWDALLGSSEDEEEEDQDARERYRNLLLGDSALSSKDDGIIEDTFEDEGDEEEQIDENKPTEEETTLEKYKRKERERKQRKREEKLARKESTNPASTDLGFDDPFFTSASSTSLKRKEKEATRASKAEAARERAEKATELELLMHDETPDNTGGSHFNINHILKAQKATKHKKMKKRDEERELDLQEGFKMDVNDPRFADVYRGGEFAIDPNSAAFRKGLPGMEELLKENRRRKRETDGGKPEESKKKRK